MSARIIPITSRIWNRKKLTERMTLISRDDKNGVTVDIRPDAINSMLISETLIFLERCRKQNIAVEIVTHDETSYRSLKYVGVDKLAILKLASS